MKKERESDRGREWRSRREIENEGEEGRSGREEGEIEREM